MIHKRKRITALWALVMAVVMLLSACGGKTDGGEEMTSDEAQVQEEIFDPNLFMAHEIRIDENGLATWDPVPGADRYLVVICYDVNGAPCSDVQVEITETQFQLYEGYAVHVRPIRADGEMGVFCVSDYYGTGAPDMIVYDHLKPSTEEPSVIVPDATMEEESLITIDAQGNASWVPVEGAEGYKVTLTTDDYLLLGEKTITETAIWIPEGCRLDVQAIIPGGEAVSMSTAGYGEPVYASVLNRRPHAVYDIDFDALVKWDLVASILPDSIMTNADGTVSFTSVAPNGNEVRFYGENVTVTPGSIQVHPLGRIVSLDAIGRIYTMELGISDPGTGSNWCTVFGGYSFDGLTSVDSIDQLMFCTGWRKDSNAFDSGPMDELAHFQPNYVAFGTQTFVQTVSYNEDSFTVASCIVGYDDSSLHTGIRDMTLYFDNYGAYMEGEKYIPGKEIFDLEGENIPFALALIPDLQHELYPASTEELAVNNSCSIEGSVGGHFIIGDLKDAEGNVLDKNNARVYEGTTLEVTVGQYSFDMPLPIIPRYEGAQNLHELTPWAVPEAMGTLNILVIPVAWQDQPESRSDEAYASFRSEMGRVMDENGNITDYSDGLADGRMSVSGYFGAASYGKLTVNSFVTDWYDAPYDFAVMESQMPEDLFIQDMMTWLYETYPDMDWSQFDRDGNGYFDSVILLNAGARSFDGYVVNSFSGGVTVRRSYVNDYVGTASRPGLNGYVICHSDLFWDDVIIHEFGHILGLIDYYDVTYSGIDAVGNHDMQSGNRGDWNPYSKYAVGWIEPQVVTGLESGRSVEISIGSFAHTGDAIVIPIAGDNLSGPFGEYIMVDLFVGEGINSYGTEDTGLDGARGVRIYHVNATMEYRELESEDAFNPGTHAIGTIHYANDYKKDGSGLYNVEVIQAGRDNTFTDVTNLRTQLQPGDLFEAGDVFTTARYSEFFVDGHMDDGRELGYTVEIVSITTDANGETVATIRITAK